MALLGNTKRQLFPIRSVPKEGELFSSWLATVALDHGITVNSLALDLFGRTSIAKRDIDRYADLSVVKKLALKVDVDVDDAAKTSLFLKVLPILKKENEKCDFFNQIKSPWCTRLNNIYSAKKTFGLTFCPLCFREDPFPYFRVDWRLSFVTLCFKHGCLLLDRCPSCGMDINLYRISATAGSLAHCWNCAYDFRRAKPIVNHHFLEYIKIQNDLLLRLNEAREVVAVAEKNAAFFSILYNISYLIKEIYMSVTKKTQLSKYVHYEKHAYPDSFSPINRMIIFGTAYKSFELNLVCNFNYYLALAAADRINYFHRAKRIPCGDWCTNHDFLNICDHCKHRTYDTVSDYLKVRIEDILRGSSVITGYGEFSCPIEPDNS